jgi:hypothetical protein
MTMRKSSATKWGAPGTQQAPDPVMAITERAISAYNAYQTARASFYPIDCARSRWFKDNPEPAATNTRAMARYCRRRQETEKRIGYTAAARRLDKAAKAAIAANQELRRAAPQTMRGLGIKAAAIVAVDLDGEEIRGVDLAHDVVRLLVREGDQS